MVLSTADGDTIALVGLAGESDFEFVKRASDKMIRRYAKENFVNMANIINKGLNSGKKENIINVNVLFEATEEIGREQEIINGV